MFVFVALCISPVLWVLARVVCVLFVCLYVYFYLLFFGVFLSKDICVCQIRPWYSSYSCRLLERAMVCRLSLEALRLLDRGVGKLVLLVTKCDTSVPWSSICPLIFDKLRIFSRILLNYSVTHPLVRYVLMQIFPQVPRACWGSN